MLRQDPQFAEQVAFALSKEVLRLAQLASATHMRTPLLEQTAAPVLQSNTSVLTVSCAAAVESYYRSGLNSYLNAMLTKDAGRVAWFPNMHVQARVFLATPCARRRIAPRLTATAGVLASSGARHPPKKVSIVLSGKAKAYSGDRSRALVGSRGLGERWFHCCVVSRLVAHTQKKERWTSHLRRRGLVARDAMEDRRRGFPTDRSRRRRYRRRRRRRRRRRVSRRPGPRRVLIAHTPSSCRVRSSRRACFTSTGSSSRAPSSRAASR